MQPPIKPWDNGVMNRYPPVGRPPMMTGGSPLLHSSSPNIPVGMSTPVVQASSNQQRPPPLPRRAPLNNQNLAYRSRVPTNLTGPSGYGLSSPYGGYGSFGGYGSYGSYNGLGGYGGLGSYGLGGYGGFNSYGSYGMNRFGSPNPNDPESRFIQLAEESSRPAFQSIESLVQAFHSVSMMLDSTFNAVYTSFRAVLGVAENFGRLRSLLGQFFSSVALFRAFIWLYKKVLYVLGLRRENPSQDQLWQAAIQATGEEIAVSSGRPRSSWPILMFMGIVFSGPYLIFKLMSSLSKSVENTETVPAPLAWNPELTPGTPAVALYGFQARSDDEISFYPGQRIIVAPASFQRKELHGWLLAKVDGTSQIGLVPYNYIAASTQNSVSNPQEVQSKGLLVNQSHFSSASSEAALPSADSESPLPKDPIKDET